MDASPNESNAFTYDLTASYTRWCQHNDEHYSMYSGQLFTVGKRTCINHLCVAEKIIVMDVIRNTSVSRIIYLFIEYSRSNLRFRENQFKRNRKIKKCRLPESNRGCGSHNPVYYHYTKAAVIYGSFRSLCLIIPTLLNVTLRVSLSYYR